MDNIDQIVGFGNPGFKFTEAYNPLIIEIYEWCTQNDLTDIIYSDFQEYVSEYSKMDLPKSKIESKIRMIIPFLSYLGALKNENLIYGGKKIRTIKSTDLFSDFGILFVSFLRIYVIYDENKKEISSTVNRKLNDIFQIFGLKFFINLMSYKPQYAEIFKFLLKYKFMSHTDFYVLASLIHENKIHLIEKEVLKYRANDSEITPERNVNDFNYISSFLEQIGIVTITNDHKIYLSRFVLNLREEFGNEFEQYFREYVK